MRYTGYEGCPETDYTEGYEQLRRDTAVHAHEIGQFGVLLQINGLGGVLFDIETCLSSVSRPHELIGIGRTVTEWGGRRVDADEGRFWRSHLFGMAVRCFGADNVCGRHDSGMESRMSQRLNARLCTNLRNVTDLTSPKQMYMRYVTG